MNIGNSNLPFQIECTKSRDGKRCLNYVDPVMFAAMFEEADSWKVEQQLLLCDECKRNVIQTRPFIMFGVYFGKKKCKIEVLVRMRGYAWAHIFDEVDHVCGAEIRCLMRIY